MARTAPTIPIELSNGVTVVAYSNMTFYLNSTNSHYHLKGLIKDILPESRGFISVMIDFRNQSTVTSVHSILYTLHGPIDSNTTVPFDIDTGYTQAQQRLEALIT
ncbi:MAG: hypothetical protein FIO03_00305 [Nitrosopumilales archaeon]|nr:hypothetical protein [Nitrosopumilales archaeon]MRN68206.1 hypothetical protein [Nitrosopumilales archaeon]